MSRAKVSMAGEFPEFRSQHLSDQLEEAQQKFDRACDQIAVLDRQIHDLDARYRRAVKQKKNSYRYNLRLKLSVTTGIKMMYHHYASMRADEISKIRRQLGITENEEEH